MRPDAHLLHVAAGLLREGSRIDAVSRLATAAALVGLALGDPAGVAKALWVASILCGCGQLYHAVRTGFDAGLLERLAADAAADGPDVAGLDAAMTALGLVRDPKVGRDAPARCRGALALLRRQGGLLIAQLGLAAAAAFLG